jgi:regulator of sigma E protease
MIDMLINILVFLVTISVLVIVHEWGHFIVARAFGIKVLRFSVGFGKPLWRYLSRKSGTEYVVSALPLGGYVKLLDEREGLVLKSELDQAFNHKSLWVRTAVVVAGPVINIIFAILVFILIWMIGVTQIRPVIGEVLPKSIAAQSALPVGSEITAVNGKATPDWQAVILVLVRELGNKGSLNLQVLPQAATKPQSFALPLDNWIIDPLEPDLLKSLGIVPYSPFIPPIIEKVKSGEPADKAGLKVGDKIVSINGQAVHDWFDFVNYLRLHPQESLPIVLERNGKILDTRVSIGKKFTNLRWVGYLGIEPAKVQVPPQMQRKTQLNLVQALVQASTEVWSITVFNFVAIGKIIVGKISLFSLGGPISIYQTSGAAFSQGLLIYLEFLGLISVMLACLNILPIPGLDGGHLLFFIIEGIIGRPVSIAWQTLIFRIGFILLAVLIFQATINDLMRIFH